ncbi:unnamed protein product, partial [Polarella glacialis]
MAAQGDGCLPEEQEQGMAKFGRNSKAGTELGAESRAALRWQYVATPRPSQGECAQARVHTATKLAGGSPGNKAVQVAPGAVSVKTLGACERTLRFDDNSAARSSSTPPVDFWGPAPTRSGAAGSTAGSRTAKLTPHAREAPPLAAMKPRSGPHVAVTSRVVLQPNPNFDDSPPPMPTRTAATGVAFSKAAAASRSSAPVQAAKPLAPPAAVP